LFRLYQLVKTRQVPDDQGLGMSRPTPDILEILLNPCVLEAASDIDTVNGLWKGLGYYSRAARLLAAAKKVVEDLDGCLPDNAKDMESLLPGVGRYTAGAICSIAFNERVPVVSQHSRRLFQV
jgi:adenine-specific DNA glycosylase